MNIIIKEVATPNTSSYTLFAEPDFKLLKETKTIRVSSYFVTKTRVSTAIQFGQFRNTVNFAIDGFKTHEQIKTNFFEGKTEKLNYFVVSKKQNFEAYKEYVTKLVEKVVTDYFHLQLDEITVELESGKFNR